jgi:hypothetical protein
VRLSKNTKKIPWMTRTLIDVPKDAKKLSIIGGVSALWGVSEHHKKSWYVSLTSSYVDVWIPTLTIRELYRVNTSRFSHFTQEFISRVEIPRRNLVCVGGQMGSRSMLNKGSGGASTRDPSAKQCSAPRAHQQPNPNNSN